MTPPPQSIPEKLRELHVKDAFAELTSDADTAPPGSGSLR